MKKLICIILSLILSIFCVSCTPEIPPIIDRFSMYFYEYFSKTGEESFAQLKITDILDVSYYDSSKREYTVAECEVIEDYYGILKAGDKVNIPVSLEYYKVRTEKYKDIIDSLLFECDCVIAYFSNLAYYDLADESGRDKLQISNSTCRMDGFYIIPIMENKVNLEAIPFIEDLRESGYSYEGGWLISDFTDYIDQGMTLETVAQNLKSI